MAYTIALAQCQASYDYRDNIKKAEFFAQKARHANAELLIFPEYFMIPYEIPAEDYLKAAQLSDGPFVTAMQEIARKNSLWIIFTMNEKLDNYAQKSYNTTVVLNLHGNIITKYQKVHLYDAFGTCESDRTIPGEHLFTPVDTPFGRIGLGMCYDLRFPELTRMAALNGCQIMIYPSAWIKGEGKSTHWHTLLTARAIENGIFTVGCCHCGSIYLGESQVADPFGTILASGGTHEELVLAEIDLTLAEKAANANPWKKNRKDWLY